MGIDDIIESINEEIENAMSYKSKSTLDQYHIHHSLLNSVFEIEQLIKDGIVDKRYQTVLDHVKAIAHSIKPATNLDCYG